MRRIFTPFALLILSNFVHAQDEWMAMYLQGKKVGYSSFESKTVATGRFSESVSVFNGKMLGSDLSIKITNRTWSDKELRATRMEFDLESGGKLQKVVATFDATSINATSEMGGRKTKKSIPVPTGAFITDDAMTLFLHGQPPKDIYVFDPNTLELVRCEPKEAGKETVDNPLGKVEATVIDVRDPRAPMKIYLSAKGDFIKATGPFGLEIRPATKQEALATGEMVDIAVASSITPDKEIEDFLNTKTLNLRFTGADLSKLPSDAHQTVTKDGDGWVVKIHPVRPDEVESSNKLAPSEWILDDIHIPCTQQKFIDLSRSIAGMNLPQIVRAEKIRLYVHGKIKANAGIGVLRDADDILATSDGVCRDHAILMATLLRADGIPTRLVSGLVYGMGAFYYHAWVEIWTGEEWLGLDSTRPTPAIDATHIKIGQGTVGQAFTSFLLDGAKITVINP